MGAGLVLSILVLTVFTFRLLLHPPRRTYSWAVSRQLPGDPSELIPPLRFRAFTFASRGVELPAWELVGSQPEGPTLIVTGGWGDSRVTMLQRGRALTALASRVILWDTPGHGDAPGATSLGAYESEDLLALSQLFAPGRVVLLGFSLGAGVAIEAAARGSCGAIVGVIAEAPYRVPATPARNVLISLGLPHRLNVPLAMMAAGLRFGYGLDFGTSALFDRTAHAARLRVPLLVLCGEADSICPMTEGQTITAAAPTGRCVTIADAEHTTMWSFQRPREQAIAAITGFCREL